jgi:hypothetical protein
MFTPVDRIAWEAGGVKERESITRGHGGIKRCIFL